MDTPHLKNSPVRVPGASLWLLSIGSFLWGAFHSPEAPLTVTQNRQRRFSAIEQPH